MEKTQIKTQTSLKPEDVVFRTNSDSKSLILIMKDGSVVYVSPGRYGGYVTSRNVDPADILVAYYVEPSISVVKDYADREEIKKIIEDRLGLQTDAATDVASTFEGAMIEEITYRYHEVEAVVKKQADRYTVLDIAPKISGRKLAAKAVRIVKHFRGSAKHLMSNYAREVHSSLIFKYPELKDIVYYKTYTGYKGRGSDLILKIVTETPEDLIPKPVSSTKTREVAVVSDEKKSVIEELEKLAEELEEEEEESKVEVTKEDILKYLETKGLMPVKLVTFDLPTEYKGAKTEYEKTQDGKVIEKKTFSVDPTIYRTLRRKFYALLERMAFKTTAGWVLTSRADLKELNKVIAELNKLAGTSRNIWIIETYMPKDYVEHQLEQYIKEREMSLKDIVNKLQLEKLKESQRKQLQRRLEELTDIIKNLKEELRRLRR